MFCSILQPVSFKQCQSGVALEGWCGVGLLLFVVVCCCLLLVCCWFVLLVCVLLLCLFWFVLLNRYVALLLLALSDTVALAGRKQGKRKKNTNSWLTRKVVPWTSWSPWLHQELQKPPWACQKTTASKNSSTATRRPCTSSDQLSTPHTAQIMTFGSLLPVHACVRVFVFIQVASARCFVFLSFPFLFFFFFFFFFCCWFISA